MAQSLDQPIAVALPGGRRRLPEAKPLLNVGHTVTGGELKERHALPFNGLCGQGDKGILVFRDQGAGRQ